MYKCKIWVPRMVVQEEASVEFELPSNVRWSFCIDDDSDEVGARASFSTSFKVPVQVWNYGKFGYDTSGMGGTLIGERYYGKYNVIIYKPDGDEMMRGTATIEKCDGEYMYLRVSESKKDIKSKLEFSTIGDLNVLGLPDNINGGTSTPSLTIGTLYGGNYSMPMYWGIGYCKNCDGFDGKQDDFLYSWNTTKFATECDANQATFEDQLRMAYGCYPLPNCQVLVPLAPVFDAVCNNVKLTNNLDLGDFYIGMRPPIDAFDLDAANNANATYFYVEKGMAKLLETNAYQFFSCILRMMDATIIEDQVIYRKQIYTRYSNTRLDTLIQGGYSYEPLNNYAPSKFRIKYANSEKLLDDFVEINPDNASPKEIDCTLFDLAVPLTKKDDKFKNRMQSSSLYCIDNKILPEYGDNLMIGALNSVTYPAGLLMGVAYTRHCFMGVDSNRRRFQSTTYYFLTWGSPKRRLVNSVPKQLYYNASSGTYGKLNDNVKSTDTFINAGYVRRLKDKAAVGGYYDLTRGNQYRITAILKFDNLSEKDLRLIHGWMDNSCRIVRVDDYDLTTGIGSFTIETINDLQNFVG